MHRIFVRVLMSSGNRYARCAALAAGFAVWASSAHAQALSLAAPMPLPPAVTRAPAQGLSGGSAATPGIATRLRRQVVDYATTEAPGTLIVDTPNTYLYFVLGGGKAIRYGIGVGREGFTWSGTKTVERKTEWPDWLPPADMLARQPYLPRFMAGGPGNPLGARALYLSGSVYRIHGTNKPSSIGQHVSSGCIRMLNEDVIDLYARTRVGAKVVVLPMKQPHTAVAALRSTANGYAENLR